MLYAITYKDFKGKRELMFDFGQALIFDGSELTNKNFESVQERLVELLDGSPKEVKKLFGKTKTIRTEYPREKIAFWRQQLQTLEIIPYKALNEDKK